MRKYGVLACALLATSMAGAAQVGQKNYDVSARLKYEADGVKIEVLGVCDISPKEVVAWDCDGNPSPQLVEQARTIALGANDLNFRFGKKNRYALIKSYHGYTNFQSGSGNYVQTVYSSYSSGEPITQLVRFTTDPNEKEAEVIASVQVPPPPTIDIPFAEGSKWSGGGLDVEINAIQPWKPNPNAPMPTYYNGLDYSGQPTLNVPKSKHLWQIVVSVRGGQDVPVPSTYIALDEKRNWLQYVDVDGNPVSSGKYIASIKADSESARFGRNVSPKYLPVRFDRGGPSDQVASSIISNLNPKAIKFIRASSSRQLRVRLTGIPLDPK